MEEIFDIEKFNIISDEENYYFFRSLEPGDIKDLEEGTPSGTASFVIFGKLPSTAKQ